MTRVYSQTLCLSALSRVILLQDTGVVLMGDMARRFKLGSELMQATITARLGGAINGRLESGILYTPMYIERVKSQVGFLRLRWK